MTAIIRGVAVADLHLGIDNVGGLDEAGAPRRLKDFLDNFERAVDHAIETEAHLFAIAGDIFKHRNPPQRTLYLFLYQLRRLVEAGITVAIARGNHEGDADIFRANVLDTISLLETGDGSFARLPEGGQVVTFNHPRRELVRLRNGEDVDLIGIPWPRVRNLLPAMGDMPYDEVCAAADAALRSRIADLCKPTDHRQVLIAHLAVAGADQGSERWMTLGYEPTITPRDIPPEVAVAIFGHYHHGGFLIGHPVAFYCGSIARIDFGEEGQDKMFWTFEIDSDGGLATATPHTIPDRPFVTLSPTFDPAFSPESVNWAIAETIKTSQPQIADAVVRMRIVFGTAEQAAAFDEGAAAQALREAGAWWIAGLLREAPDAGRRWENIENVEAMEAPDALWRFLAAKEPDETRCRRLWTAGLELMAGKPVD
ncbi:MAG: metallophosphoesterase [Methyloceanibacter sp.]|nr:metallophosphoesterase [Methyloceanibacter sp.]